MANLPIKALDVPEPGVAAFTIEVMFEPGSVEVVDVLAGDPPFGGFFNFNTGDGIAIFSDLQVESPVSGNLLLATLRIRPPTTPSMALRIETFVDIDGNDIHAQSGEGC